MMIGEVAEKSGFSVHTLRYYEKIGLLPPSHRDRGGRRSYDDDVLRWLEFLGRLKDLGMPIRDRVLYAKLRAEGDITIESRRRLLQTYRDALAERVISLRETLDVLDAKIASYDTTGTPLKGPRK
ncbi:MerR family transcriptional regulator [Thalassospira lucentensis]|uniref:MerR family transcriptional regulator n=1 Tax=Thalassospira lucentensis TaxID=168935 RepID=A0A358HMR8_9PROT|nr:MerR family transcriptional regulator [Thalassospira lucentensis]HBU96486.1 MerR family transcriptional regulator [Thalassospira lucentensis]HCW65835.1 MerR family transcriptional regulator [Thalassospira lucentensis]|tara:strand:- start:107 stop:481 length:375 start_codon:yes stop_codon:yes gene_type:complete